MQAGKNAMEAMKEKAANVGASAKAGMDKTKATLEEKVEKVTAQHPAEKQMAEHKKELKIHEAELAKLEAKEHNASVREHARSAHTHQSQGSAAIESSHPIGGHAGGGLAHSHPSGFASGTARPSAAHSPAVETGYPKGHGPGPYPA